MVKAIGSRGGPGVEAKSCTVQLGNGGFCDARSTNDAPFPICERHLIQIIKFAMRGPSSSTTVRDADGVQRSRTQRARRDQASVVYYLDMGNSKIKIGRSSQLANRLETFYRDVNDVLAVEIGGAKTEAFRHKQFADDRIGKTENFHASDRLKAHVHQLANASNALTVSEALRQQRGRGTTKAPGSVLANWI